MDTERVNSNDSQKTVIKSIKNNKLDTFLGKYMTMMEDYETAIQYDIWCALWLLSLAVGRNSVVARPKAPCFLNLYCVLAAESGVTRKSTAVKVVERIASKFLAAVETPEVLTTTKATAEALLLELQDQTVKKGHSHLAICISEMVTFFGRERYAQTLPTLLTDLYDCPEYRQSIGTVTHGRVDFRRVWLSMLSASTPSWLIGSINPKVVEGGFTSRVFFVVGEKRKRAIAWPEETEDNDDELVQELIQIRELTKHVPRIELQDNALKYFKNWYSRRSYHRDPFRASFASREDGHILKVAALLSINRKAWEISKDDLQNAMRLVGFCKDDGYKLFEGVRDVHKSVKGMERIRGALLAAGGSGLRERDLIRAAIKHIDTALSKAILQGFHELGGVEVYEVPCGRGRKVRYYTATEVLATKQLYKDMCQRLRIEQGYDD